MGATVTLPGGYRLVAHDSLSSTNDEAKQLAAEGAPDGVVVWALQQTAGRGRQGRGWDSPPGNLYCSLVLRPEAPAAEAAQLAFVAALALGDALEGLLPDDVDLRFKWPNDVLLDGRKVAGILLESGGVSNAGLDWLVLGCGLNIRSFPEVTEGFPATSLVEAGAETVTPGDMLSRFVAGFEAWRGRWQAGGLDAVRQPWLARAARLGERIVVWTPDKRLEGRFGGLDAAGALVVELPNGGRRTITAGDVFF